MTRSDLMIWGRSRRGRDVMMALFVTAVASAQLHATSGLGAGGNALPWDTPVKTIAESLTGPVALGISVVAIAVTGMVLVFGGEITDFAKRSMYVVLAIGLLVGGSSIINSVFNFTGACI